MRKLLLCFGLIAAVTFTNAQIVIKGRVLDNRSDKPVINASVYINNTSIGTITNSTGDFSLNTNDLYSGELIISSVGYQLLSFRLKDKDADSNFYTFKLDIKENALNEVLILNDAARQNWMRIFKDNFLGITEEADNCKIENPEAVYFTAGENENSFYAFADTPLIIINKLLGYKILFDLNEFGYNKIKNATYFLGFTRYEKMGDSKKWIKRRKQNYYGSTMHFYRSLINKELETEGFSMFEIKKLAGKKDSVNNVEIPAIDGEPVLVMPIRPINILFIDSISNEYYLQFTNRIMVQFDRTIRFKNYYVTEKFSPQSHSNFGFTAYINMLTDKVELDTKGILRDPMAIVYNGFWMYEKMANQLPFDYIPE